MTTARGAGGVKDAARRFTRRTVTPARRSQQLADRRLFERYRRHGDTAAREALVKRHLPLASQLARRYHRGSEPLDDLVQVASLGLLKAIDRFEPDRNLAFSSYAAPTILGELKRHFRDLGWSIRVPRDLQELVPRVERAATELEARLARAPTPAEIADAVGVTPENVLEAREAALAHYAISLDRPPNEAELGEDLVAFVGDEDHGFCRAEDAATLERLMDVLSDRERAILWLRFGEDLTQSEIGARVGVSQMQVSRVLRHVLARLSRRIHDEPPSCARLQA